MTRVVINWPRGTIRIEQWAGDRMTEVFEKIAAEIGLPSDKFEIWKDEDFETRRQANRSYRPLPRTGSFANTASEMTKFCTWKSLFPFLKLRLMMPADFFQKKRDQPQPCKWSPGFSEIGPLGWLTSIIGLSTNPTLSSKKFQVVTLSEFIQQFLPNS
jgi:hypothetical protein